ncbi:DUF3747 domain-containing protein [Leptothoe kymatousa]|uniref:DUF3747 domain-containing protein n=1 Tax=Leptothoe kymatousa TAU-MAC 1615 TaxID=2364775 RepID=A0ABS5Y797_9CYAN|nr:DUF3747 domain-containing protein [Leptothoe kymatousa]MBT9313702.1 DUF3747 domain-containing protein [Leptothoe kymatousa TAU-MAC 1615]
MKPLRLALAAATAATLTLFGVAPRVNAQAFDNVEVTQEDFVLVAAPGGGLLGRPQFMIIEQKSDAQLCWSESGSNPTQIEPLLLNFDFSGICGRSTDSNGYSIRAGDGDAGSRFNLDLQEEDGEYILVGRPSSFPTNPFRSSDPIRLGRTFGQASNGFTKVFLNPGWRLTRRSFDGRALGHLYLTNDATLASLVEGGGPIVTEPPTTEPETPTTIAFRDVTNDVYANQISRAVEIGFIAGFQDGTFRPRNSLTREQLVSMVIEALDAQENISVALPSQVTANPFSDVASNRWSAAKIQFASQNGIVSGYEDGNFRPAQEVTRAEMMAVLRRAAEYRKRSLGQGTALTPTQQAFTFSDTQGHWAAPVISSLSAYCGIATPVNESGTAFVPNSDALRNYAATAVVRLVDCAN